MGRPKTVYIYWWLLPTNIAGTVALMEGGVQFRLKKSKYQWQTAGGGGVNNKKGLSSLLV